MEISSHEQAGFTVLSLAGRLDVSTVPEFNSAWQDLLDAGVKKIIVKMEDVEYISSAGLRSILQLAKSSRAKSVKLGFASLHEMVLDMFRLSGFISVLETFRSVEAAIEDL